MLKKVDVSIGSVVTTAPQSLQLNSPIAGSAGTKMLLEMGEKIPAIPASEAMTHLVLTENAEYGLDEPVVSVVTLRASGGKGTEPGAVVLSPSPSPGPSMTCPSIPAAETADPRRRGGEPGAASDCGDEGDAERWRDGASRSVVSMWSTVSTLSEGGGTRDMQVVVVGGGFQVDDNEGERALW